MTRQMPAHWIVDVSYSADRLECACGVVMRASGKAGDWADHRRKLGLSVKSVGQTIGKRLAGQSR